MIEKLTDDFCTTIDENRLFAAGKVKQIEYNNPEHSGSGGEEIELEFENGTTLLIYKSEDGRIMIETD